MPRYKLQYAKEGPSRFISHLDLLRTIERAARRAGLPLIFSQGFNPHPKITFAAPLGVGVAGEAEWGEIELLGDIPEEEVTAAMSGALPEGLRVNAVVRVPEEAPSLMSRVERGAYRCDADLAGPPPPGELEQAVQAFLDRREIAVRRKTRAGVEKKVDIRPGILVMSVRADDDIIRVEMELKTGSSGNVRVEEALGALLDALALPLKTGDFSLFRTGVYAGSGERREEL